MHGVLGDRDSLTSEVGDEPQDDTEAIDKEEEVNEALPGEKYVVGDTAEAVIEVNGEDDDAPDLQQIETEASPHDHEYEFKQPSSEEVEESGEFIAAWIRTNFPDVASEVELRSQAAASDNMVAPEDARMPSTSFHHFQVTAYALGDPPAFQLQGAKFELTSKRQ
ncbi:uncharacterized protein IUM83_18855 [Phytophthora cinnamomi]|uniref:uncharacterized protein n=1 Tax=Phytophthora cinnamomi TaxID=4785 RepID=UPI00355A5AD8|nr:hypothetical protein IUM83_18855 [Phytophthora cinnamomi]